MPGALLLVDSEEHVHGSPVIGKLLLTVMCSEMEEEEEDARAEIGPGESAAFLAVAIPRGVGAKVANPSLTPDAARIFARIEAAKRASRPRQVPPPPPSPPLPPPPPPPPPPPVDDADIEVEGGVDTDCVESMNEELEWLDCRRPLRPKRKGVILMEESPVLLVAAIDEQAAEEQDPPSDVFVVCGEQPSARGVSPISVDQAHQHSWAFLMCELPPIPDSS